MLHDVAPLAAATLIPSAAAAALCVGMIAALIPGATAGQSVVPLSDIG